jgi:ferric iron reductase protein FhuF
VTGSDALRRAAALGPYFAVDLDLSGPGWIPLQQLVDDPAVVRERVEHVRASLAMRCGVPVDEIDARASASIHHLALAARLVAPSLAAAAIDGVVPEFGLADVWWQRVDGGPVPVAVVGGGVALPAATAADARDAGARLIEVVTALVAPVIEAFAAAASVSRVVLWGNVASALAGAAAMLRRSDGELTVDPVAVVEAMLQLPGPLHRGGVFDPDGRFFARSSCCLFYRIPNGGKCGDCVLL